MVYKREIRWNALAPALVTWSWSVINFQMMGWDRVYMTLSSKINFNLLLITVFSFRMKTVLWRPKSKLRTQPTHFLYMEKFLTSLQPGPWLPLSEISGVADSIKTFLFLGTAFIMKLYSHFTVLSWVMKDGWKLKLLYEKWDSTALLNSLLAQKAELVDDTIGYVMISQQ